MALLGQPRTTPPDGWTFTQPETQTRLESQDSLEELTGIVIEHRRYKGLEPTDAETVRLEIQRQICAQMPPGVCRGEPGEDYQPMEDQSRRLTLEKIQSFSLSIFEWIRGGGQLVDEEESQRRAKICLGCPLNKAPHSCSCAPLWLFLKTLIPNRRKIDNLHICGICGCVNGVKVLMPLDVLKASVAGRDLRFPSHCWMRVVTE